jgi:hypothetical protein
MEALAERLGQFSRNLTARESHQYHLLLSELLGTQFDASNGKPPPERWRSLMGLVADCAPAGVLHRGIPPSMPHMPTLTNEASLVHGVRLGRTGPIAHALGGPASLALHTSGELIQWLSELTGHQMQPFGEPYFYFFEREGDCLPTQVHEVAVREADALQPEMTSPVTLVSYLLWRSVALGSAGRMYSVDAQGRLQHLDERSGDWVVIRASGTPYGREPVGEGQSVCSLQLLYIEAWDRVP